MNIIMEPSNNGSTRGTRKRKAANLSLPKITEDASERKRVLNVLAQRRYRKYFCIAQFAG